MNRIVHMVSIRIKNFALRNHLMYFLPGFFSQVDWLDKNGSHEPWKKHLKMKELNDWESKWLFFWNYSSSSVKMEALQNIIEQRFHIPSSIVSRSPKHLIVEWSEIGHKNTWTISWILGTFFKKKNHFHRLKNGLGTSFVPPKIF